MKGIQCSLGLGVLAEWKPSAIPCIGICFFANHSCKHKPAQPPQATAPPRDKPRSPDCVGMLNFSSVLSGLMLFTSRVFKVVKLPYRALET